MGDKLMMYETFTEILSALKTVHQYYQIEDYSKLVIQIIQDMQKLPLKKTSIEEIVNELLYGVSVHCYKNGKVATVYDDEFDSIRIESDNVLEIIENLAMFFDDQFERPLLDCIEEASYHTSIPNGGWQNILEFFESEAGYNVIYSNPEYFIPQYEYLKLLCNPSFITLSPTNK